MKRSRSGDGLSPSPSSRLDGAAVAEKDDTLASCLDQNHPVVAFHREALIADYWHVIREQLRMEYEEIFQTGTRRAASGARYTATIAEPSKFWRHCREALAKWVLSQVARYRPIQTAAQGEESEEVDYDALAAVAFLPSQSMVQSPFFHRDARAAAGVDVLTTPPASSQVATTFDDQLLRDLTFKSTEAVRNQPTFIQDVHAFLREFNVYGRCDRAVKDIDSQISRIFSRRASDTSQATRRGGADRLVLKPVVTHIAERDKTLPMHKRIQGDIVEIAISWPVSYTSGAAMDCSVKSLQRSAANVRPVVIPSGSWDRLRRCYETFGKERDMLTYGNGGDDGGGGAENFFALRAATVVLRYEHCLASGSLQLCADSALKVLLNRSGYNVMDLCASPINAYMADLSGGSTQQPTGRVAPRRFCSAFWDTDRYFGSMGSALLFDVHETYRRFRYQDEAHPASAAAHREEPDAPLLLTLDVPYDEDLCELLFLKLAADCRRYLDGLRDPVIASSSSKNEDCGCPRPRFVDFVLVLPLWWNVSFCPTRCPKLIFENRPGETANDGTARISAADLVRKYAAYSHEGYQIQYHWLTELPKAMEQKVADEGGDAEQVGARDVYLAVFDAVFVRESYSYYCTATNQVLSGVTATEVIGISLTPSTSQDERLKGLESPSCSHLKGVLRRFYEADDGTKDGE